MTTYFKCITTYFWFPDNILFHARQCTSVHSTTYF